MSLTERTSFIVRVVRCFGSADPNHLKEYLSEIDDLEASLPWYLRTDGERIVFARIPFLKFAFARRSDEETSAYIRFLILKSLLTQSSASVAISTVGWDSAFKNEPKTRMSAFVQAEEYELAVSEYKGALGTDGFHKSMYELFFFALSRMGVFYQQIFDSEAHTTAERIQFHRYLWQKGDFRGAGKIGMEISCFDLPPDERFSFLNNHARVLRDIGELERCNAAVQEMAKLLDPLQPESLSPERLKKSGALLSYNTGINRFIAGDHEAALALTLESLADRESDYEKNFLQLRMAKSHILLGRYDEARKLLEQVEARGLDKWGQSLFYSVMAEYNLVGCSNSIAAEKFWELASAQLSAVSSAVNYASLGKSQLMLARGQFNDAEALAKSELSSGLLEARILYLIARAASTGADTSKLCRMLRKGQKLADFEGSYLGLFINAFLHLDASSFGDEKFAYSPKEIRQYAVSKGIPYGSHVKNISKGVQPVPTVFISYSHDGTPQDWVYSLVTFLRANGIDAEYDESLRGKGSTVNFDDMMLKHMTESDFVVALMSPEYATRVKDPSTGIAVEFNLMQSDILRKQLKRFIFCLQSGSYSSSLPATVAKVDCYDLTSVDFAAPGQVLEDLLRHLLGIERIDMKPVGSRPPLTPRTP